MRAPRAIDAKYESDHAVCSETLTTTAEPLNREEMIGLIKLWNYRCQRYLVLLKAYGISYRITRA